MEVGYQGTNFSSKISTKQKLTCSLISKCLEHYLNHFLWTSLLVVAMLVACWRPPWNSGHGYMIFVTLVTRKVQFQTLVIYSQKQLLQYFLQHGFKRISFSCSVYIINLTVTFENKQVDTIILWYLLKNVISIQTPWYPYSYNCPNPCKTIVFRHTA